LECETNVADTRIHGTTKEQVGKRFEQERAALLPLPADRFPFFREGRRMYIAMDTWKSTPSR
jgi:hypothetical protein